MDETQENSKNKELQEKFIVLQIENENFVIPLEYVSEIVKVKDVTEAPHQPDWVKGIMNLRDSIISLVDTRKRLGIKSFMDESHLFCDSAKNTHLNWIKKLEESVINNTPFTLLLDHTKCDFGKLTLELLARSDISNTIKKKLIEIDPIHKAIYDGGKEVVNSMEKRHNELALKKVKEIENILIPKMIAYIEELDNIFKISSKI